MGGGAPTASKLWRQVAPTAHPPGSRVSATFSSFGVTDLESVTHLTSEVISCQGPLHRFANGLVINVFLNRSFFIQN